MKKCIRPRLDRKIDVKGDAEMEEQVENVADQMDDAAAMSENNYYIDHFLNFYRKFSASSRTIVLFNGIIKFLFFVCWRLQIAADERVTLELRYRTVEDKIENSKLSDPKSIARNAFISIFSIYIIFEFLKYFSAEVQKDVDDRNRQISELKLKFDIKS